MDRPRARREEPQGPLPLGNVAGTEEEWTTDGRGAVEGLPSGGRQRTLGREDRLEGLPREVDRQAMVDRVEPR